MVVAYDGLLIKRKREKIMRNPKFKEKLDEMLAIHEAKNHDYSGEGGDPYKNFRESEKLGIPAWKGILVRIGDKYSRIMNLANSEAHVKDEKIEDTLLDLANYSILCLLVKEEAESEGIKIVDEESKPHGVSV